MSNETVFPDHDVIDHLEPVVPAEANVATMPSAWPHDEGNFDAELKSFDETKQGTALDPFRAGATRAPNPSGLSAPHRIEARTMAIQAALLGFRHAPELHYTQLAARWEGIAENRKAWRRQYPTHADCSAFVTWCVWNGLDHFHVRDVVNGQSWRAGWTGTMVEHGVRIDGRFKPQRADAVLYGDPVGRSGHTALVIGHDDRYNGQLMVVSFGSEAGPFYLPWNYRNDVHGIWRYI